MQIVRSVFLVLIVFGLGLGYAASFSVDVLSPSGDVDLYNGSVFDVSLNVSCGDADCGDVNVSLLESYAPASCREILEGYPAATDGTYTVCPDGRNCVDVYCDMTDGGWASIFTLSGDLTLGERDCIFHNYNDDMDSTGLWTDLSAKVKTDNGMETDSSTWFTWERNGSDLIMAGPLSDRPAGLGSYAQPVPLPAANKTIWFDWQNHQIAWDGNYVDFSILAIPADYIDSWDNTRRYYISDGVSRIHVGRSEGGCGWGSSKLLSFDFRDASVTSEDAEVLSPPNGWYSTEEDAFAHVLYTVNGRVMYFDGEADGAGHFALGGDLLDPNSQYTSYAVPIWESPSQPGLDFFARVDESGDLWFGDWGHDNGGYFNCGNDEYFGIGKTNIRATYNSTGIEAASAVSDTLGATPFYTTDQNPQTLNLLGNESEAVNFSVIATSPGNYMFSGYINESSSPFLENVSEAWKVHTYFDVPPTARQQDPFDGYYIFPGDMVLNASCVGGIIDTIEVWTDAGGAWDRIYSNSSYHEGDIISATASSVPNGNYTWGVWCNATNGASDWSANRTVHVSDSGVFRCMILDTPGSYKLLMNISGIGDCFQITAQNVTLDCDGYKISGQVCGGGSAVNSGQPGTVVKNCIIDGFSNGVYFGPGSGAGRIEDSEISSCSDNGIYLDSSSDNNISGVAVNGSSNGIYLYGDLGPTENNLMSGNVFSSNDNGVELRHSDWNHVLNNTFIDNNVGFYLYYADNNMIGRNNLSQTQDANFGSGSCPFLYLWNGSGYSYYTDLAGESIGASWFETPLYEAGIYELGGFESQNGTYKMKIREVIPESDFVDEMKLVVVDVPDGYGVLNQWHNTYSDDQAPPKEFMTIKDPRKPVAATDKYGIDVLAEVSGKDGVPLPVRDNEPNSVIVDFGSIQNPQYAKLVVSGWSAYEDNPGLSSQKNLRVETPDGTGGWKIAKIFGKFSGDSRAYIFDIAGILEANDTRMRISAPYSKTTINVLDQVLLDDSEPVDFNVTYIEPRYADLRWGGATDYEYATSQHRHIVTNEQLPNIENFLMYGNFTKYGGVMPLVEAADDMFAIMRHGDEMALEFEDVPLMEGNDRKVFLQADVMYSIKYSVKGFVSESIEPMPFHGMSQYPYGTSESYPDDADHRAYRAEWNTREYAEPMNAGGSLPYSFNNTVFENTISGDEGSTGLYLDHEDSTQILNNSIYGVEVGIDLYESVNSLINGNSIGTVFGRGMMLRQGSDGNAVLSNTILSNNSADCYYDGCGALFIGRSENNLIDNNTLTALDGHGIYVGFGYYNNLTGNRINATGDSGYAIYLAKDSSENMVLHNTIYGDYWVADSAGGNYFNDSISGNRYYFAEGTGAWEVFDIVDTNDDGWADDGSDLPFSESILGSDLWSGSGEDYHPAVEPFTPPPAPSASSGSNEPSRRSVTITGTAFNCSSGLLEMSVSGSGSGKSGLTIRLFKMADLSYASGTTDADGKALFTIGESGEYKGYMRVSRDYNPAESDPMLLELCQNEQPVADNQSATLPGPENPVETPAISPPPVNDSGRQDMPPPGPTQQDAADAIAAASSALDDAGGAGKDTSGAREKLNEANAAFASGDFAKAIQLAGEARQLALDAKAPPPPVLPPSDVTADPAAPAPRQGSWAAWMWVLGALVAALAVLAGGYFLFGRNRRK